MKPRAIVVYAFLLGVKALSWLCYRVRVEWIGEHSDDVWEQARLGILLHHTSLYEPIFAAGLPTRMLKRMATNGAVPIADKTLERPIVGRFFRLIAAQVISVTRERDNTWKELLSTIRPGAFIVMMPEGRMKRRDGLDAAGQKMTVRGGIADVIQAMPAGYMVIAYSGGLHHVQHPGEALPRLFKTVRLRLEAVDIATYREEMLARAGPKRFKRTVIQDMERRRDTNCPPQE